MAVPEPVADLTYGAVFLLLVARTPLASVWFETISGLTPELTQAALWPARILVLMPAMTVWLSFQRSMLVNARNTAHVTWATGLEVLATATVLATGILWPGLSGAFVAATTLTIGRTLAITLLLKPARESVRKILGEL